MTFEITEYGFTLPLGYVDEDGTLHKQGRMREASIADEVIPMRHPHVQDNPAYLNAMVISRVVTQLGTLRFIDTQVIERLFVSDFAYLKELYERINKGTPAVEANCPKCRHKFDVEVPPPAKV